MKQHVSIRHNGSLAEVATSWLFLGILVPAAALLALVWLQPWVPVAYLVRDPLAVAREAPKCCSVYYGVISNLGVMLWMAAAAICLFTALMAYTARAGSARTGFFLAGGLFTLWLGMDDFFLVHEEVLPQFGIPQIVTYAVYAAIGLVYLIAAWRFILTSRVSLFLIAGLALAGSMGLDALVASEAPLWVFLEDALKFVGIAFWAGFHVAAAVAVAEELVTGRITTVQVSAVPVRRLVSLS
jgi:hypothetical protein